MWDVYGGGIAPLDPLHSTPTVSGFNRLFLMYFPNLIMEKHTYIHTYNQCRDQKGSLVQQSHPGQDSKGRRTQICSFNV